MTETEKHAAALVYLHCTKPANSPLDTHAPAKTFDVLRAINAVQIDPQIHRIAKEYARFELRETFLPKMIQHFKKAGHKKLENEASEALEILTSLGAVVPQIEDLYEERYKAAICFLEKPMSCFGL